jgi:hypothetical protein
MPVSCGFRDSSGLAWDPDATLTIDKWTGEPFGGGAHQIIVGDSGTALTSNQVRQIFFLDPPGLTPGVHAAQILASGEVVPADLPPTGTVLPRLSLQKRLDGNMRIMVAGESGYRYAIETSSNLVAWTSWTNRTATNGTFTAVDTTASTQPMRFYRAYLLP